MNAEGCPFKGCLYFGLMLTPDGPKVIEYNCRFGDPETQVVLPLLESDLLKVMTACTEGTLADTEVRFSDGAAACVILASGGYPVAYEKGKSVSKYIAEAGGYASDAYKSKSYIIYMNGKVAKVGHGTKVQPGCEIVVPAKMKRKMSVAETMSLGTSMSSIAAMIATIANLSK